MIEPQLFRSVPTILEIGSATLFLAPESYSYILTIDIYPSESFNGGSTAKTPNKNIYKVLFSPILAK